MRSLHTQQKVKELVTQFPSLLENYSSNKLVAAYWEHVEGARTVQHIGHYCSSPEAITRAYRRLVTSGEIVLPTHTQIKREQYQEEFRLDYSPV